MQKKSIVLISVLWLFIQLPNLLSQSKKVNNLKDKELEQKELAKFTDTVTLNSPQRQSFRNAAVSIDLQEGLIAYYPFNGNANDESGNGHHGTVTGATLTTDRFGNTISAYKFDGVDDYIDVPHSPEFNLGTMSISCWVIDYSSPLHNMILLKGRWSTSGPQKRQFSLISNLSTASPVNYFGLYKSNQSWDNCLSTDNILNVWTHILVTYDGSEQNIYRNGNLIATCNSSSSNYVPNNPESLLIGAGYNTSSGWHIRNGVLDDLRIYNRALTSNEITALFNEGCLLNNIVINETINVDTTIYAKNLIELHNVIVNAPYELTLKAPEILISPNCKTIQGAKLTAISEDGCLQN